jgi:hypothetical protein
MVSLENNFAMRLQKSNLNPGAAAQKKMPSVSYHDILASQPAKSVRTKTAPNVRPKSKVTATAEEIHTTITSYINAMINQLEPVKDGAFVGFGRTYIAHATNQSRGQFAEKKKGDPAYAHAALFVLFSRLPKVCYDTFLQLLGQAIAYYEDGTTVYAMVDQERRIVSKTKWQYFEKDIELFSKGCISEEAIKTRFEFFKDDVDWQKGYRAFRDSKNN